MIALIILLLLAAVYKNNFTKSAIYNKVVNQEGYHLSEIQKQIKFTADIKSDWIPTTEGENFFLNKKIGRIDHVDIILKSVWNRGNDFYFTFDEVPDIKYKEGEIVGNFSIDENGSIMVKDYTYRLYNKDKINIEIGQRGFGPNSIFSFGIDTDDHDLIKDGFTLVCNGMNLYHYTKD
jgi:hypothetical protein